LNVEHKASGVIGEKTLGMVDMTNSIWLDKTLPVNQNCLDSLSRDYYAYAYETDFANKTQTANRAIENFIKQKTRGLIDVDLNFTPDTLFVLMNTLYLKDVWNEYGNDIALTSKAYSFTENDGEEENLRFLQGKYLSGKVYQSEDFSSFYTTTYNGYKIKFLLPNEGKTIEETFTKENIYTLNSITDYKSIDEEKKEEYHTRCLFPEFEGDYDNDVSGILKKDFGVQSIFDMQTSDLTNLTSVSAFCPIVRHIAELKVDKKGIEGAAVTIMPKAGAPGPGEYKQVYLDFVVNKTFGFVLTDSYNTILFTGVIGDV
jgi:serine protease inhibitor